MLRIALKMKPVHFSPHLQEKELRCNCTRPSCTMTMLHQTTLEAFENLRAVVNRPIVIDSAYRCPEHNREVDGEERSMHMIGCALDMRIPNGMTLDGFEVLARKAGFTYTKKYERERFLHADTRSDRWLF